MLNKKLMHIMIDGEVTEGDIEVLSKTLKQIEDKYDIVITSYNMKIDIYDTDTINLMNEKLDIVIEQLQELKNLRNDFRNIKYVFGLSGGKDDH